MNQSKPTFRDIQNPGEDRPRRPLSEAVAQGRNLRALLAPFNKSTAAWQKRVAFLQTMSLRHGSSKIADDAAALKAEVLSALSKLKAALDEAPESRASSRVDDTDQGMRSILTALDGITASE